MAACAEEAAAAARRRVRGCGWRIVFVFVCARERFGGALWLMDVVRIWDFLSARTLELLVWAQ